MRLGVVLLNLGGPTDEASVKTFLHNLFSDPDIIKLGGGLRQKALASFITARRLKSVRARYTQINTCAAGCGGNQLCPNHGGKSNCCSPINPLTELQRDALETELKEQIAADFVKVYTAMRYWCPTTEQVQQQMKADGITHCVLLPLYPHFSFTTTGSSFNYWQKVKDANWQEWHIPHYPTHPLLLKAINRRIDEAIGDLPIEAQSKTHLVFTAHGTPLSEVNAGDPYTLQVKETVNAIMANRQEPHWLAFQSKVGPAKWTKPATDQLTDQLVGYGIKNLVLVPIAFVTDHIETLMELNIELREELEAKGHKPDNMVVCKGLNDDPYFIDALASLVQQSIREKQQEVYV